MTEQPGNKPPTSEPEQSKRLKPSDAAPPRKKEHDQDSEAPRTAVPPTSS